MEPGQEKVYKIAPFLEQPLINWMLPRAIVSANREKISHKEEVNKMKDLWNKISIPVMYLQGEKDKLVNISNNSFTNYQLVNAPYVDTTIFKCQQEVILNSQQTLIRSKIFEMLEMLREETGERRSRN